MKRQGCGCSERSTYNTKIMQAVMQVRARQVNQSTNLNALLSLDTKGSHFQNVFLIKRPTAYSLNHRYCAKRDVILRAPAYHCVH